MQWRQVKSIINQSINQTMLKATHGHSQYFAGSSWTVEITTQNNPLRLGSTEKLR